MGELTIEQRRINSITDLAYIKNYLAVALNPTMAVMVCSMLDNVVEVLKDFVKDN